MKDPKKTGAIPMHSTTFCDIVILKAIFSTSKQKSEKSGPSAKAVC
jgi:hypothetical protein